MDTFRLPSGADEARVDPAPADPASLLHLALSRPGEALERARHLLDGDPPPFEASIARQAVGVVLREFGDIDAAIAELRVARRLAQRAGDPDREADVLGTLGVALAFAGRPVAGRNALDAAVERSTGHQRGRALLRRGAVLVLLGRHREALPDLNSAIAVLRQAGDVVWVARGLTERATGYLSLGQVRRAAADLRVAEELFVAGGQELESADAAVHRGVLALRIGDVPGALAGFDEAAERFRQLGTPDFDLVLHRCAALLAGGLPKEALQAVDAAIDGVEDMRCRPTTRAELLLTASGCALAAGDAATAADRARQARQLFVRQGRSWWAAHARLAQVRAELAAGSPPARLLVTARRCVEELAGLGSAELPLAQLTAGRVALARGRADVARGYLRAAAAGRRRGTALARALAWLAEALDAEAGGDARRLMTACRRGLQVIDEYRAVLGSSELRAQATAHGAELAALGQRRALQLGRPRLLLVWSERWRAVALDVPAVRPPPDEELQAMLASMRSARTAPGPSRAGPAGAGGTSGPSGEPWAGGPERDQGTPAGSRDRHRLELAVRSRALRARGAGRRGDGALGGFDPDRLLDELGDGRLLELVEVDGRLQVLVCGGGRVRRATAGPMDRAVREVLFARFALRRLATRPSAVADADALGRLTDQGSVLAEALLGDAAAELGEGALVVVPPARLHAVPWGLVPSLRAREFSVAPSASTWLRARRALREPAGTAPGSGGVVLVRGPGLASQGAEVPQLALVHREPGAAAPPQVLGEGTATVARVLEAIDGADLVHIAAHGTFRADSPLFSSLTLDDGPLTLYDLEQLRSGPRRVVLSSCESGVAAPAGADEILGLAGSMLPLGTNAIVASVVPVNDAAVVPLMVDLHRRLRAGEGVAAALRDVRTGAGTDDPVRVGTACSFVSLGAC